MDETENFLGTRGSQPSPEDSAVSFSLLHPPKVGRYSIIRRLGKGAFGEVLLAYDEDLDRPVAIKIPSAERISQPRDLHAFLNEARILASLDHPQIVPVYDVGQTEDGRYFIVSKFIDGSDLKTKLQDARLSLPESVELIRQVAEALHYAHKKGLVHRDIKPANVLIDTLGKPCVADFGLALKDDEFGKGAMIAGTPAYMSPEQAIGKSNQVDGRSDIFSLGVVFYELLTGRNPFRGKNWYEVLQQILATDPRPPRQIDDTIPREIERICLKSLSKQVSERYTTAKNMVEDLSRYCQSVGDREDQPIGRGHHDFMQSDVSFTQTKAAAGKRRRIEAKGLLGRKGCVFQITILCSILFMMVTIKTVTTRFRSAARVDAPTMIPSPNSTNAPTAALRPESAELPHATSAPSHPPLVLPKLPGNVFSQLSMRRYRNEEANRLGILGASYARAGDFRNAVAFQSLANQLYFTADDRKKGEDRLKLYQQQILQQYDNE
jgi:serine/threonine protein kinase